MSIFSRRAVLLGSACLPLVTTSARADAVELVIRINLPLDRTHTGTLDLQTADGTTILSGLAALGKADSAKAGEKNNPDRLPIFPFGDAPEGTYSVPRLISTGDGTSYSSHSYGSAGALVLKPEAGDALTAALNGRVGLLIHSGDLGAGGHLRATHGCIRLSGADMQRLIQAIMDAGDNTTFNRCDITVVSVLIGDESEEGAGDDEDDPPFDIEDLLSPIPITKP